jgi:hypothetical protein
LKRKKVDEILFLGGIPEGFDVLFKNSSGTIFTQSLTLSQVTNVSQLVGIATGAPLFRLVVDLELNNLLNVSLKTKNNQILFIYHCRMVHILLK